MSVYESSTRYYIKTCPFCDTKNIQRMPINIICACGAKYYYHKKEWLHRGTGERRRSDE